MTTFWIRAFATGAVAIATAAHAQSIETPSTIRVYGVGNSLTADNYHVNGPYKLGQEVGIDFIGGIQINGGVGLKEQWYNYVNGIAPAEADPSSFDQALTTSRWDAIVVEPFKNTAPEESLAAKQIITLALGNLQNLNSSIYVYAPPTELREDGHTDFTGHWLAPYQGEAVGNATTRAFFRTVYNSVKASYRYNPVGMIPTGDVWADVAAKIDAGQMPGVTDSSLLYRDTLHASLLGQLVSATTWFAVTTKRNPEGMTLPTGFGDTTQEQADIIFNSVWNVIAKESAVTLVLKPGDTNGDGHVTFTDLLTIAQNYGTTTGGDWFAGDFNEDGAVNFTDLLALVQNYEQPLSEPQTVTLSGASKRFRSDLVLAQSLVPEPTSLTMIGLIAGPTFLRRRR